MSAQATNLFLLEDLGDSSRTKDLAASDLSALRTVARWIEAFVAKPHKDLGRAGSVCPFVPQARERKTLWLAPERIANQSVADVLELTIHYQRLLRTQPVAADDANYKAIVVVLTDVSADRARDLLGDVQIQLLKRLSYAEEGVVLGEFHERNDGGAIRNTIFHPFKAPVPLLLMRNAVISDWMFFLDDEDWFSLWTRRFGESAVPALAETLRHTNWRRIEA